MDIVERLRNAAFRGPTMEASHTQDIRWKAADEIEQLREALQHLIRWHDQLSAADIAKAREALKEKK